MPRTPRRTPWRPFVLALALAFGAAGAQAATLANLSIAPGAGNTPDFFDDAGATGSVATSATSVLSSGTNDFTTRYAAVVGADTGGGGGGDFTQNFTAEFTITFEVTENVGIAWSLVLDLSRVGAMTIVSDGNGDGTVTLGAMSGSVSGATLASGSLALAALGVSNAGSQGTSPNVPFSQTTSATLTGVGTGAAQLVAITLTFSGSTTTNDLPGGGIQGDEAALRMGIDSPLSFFSADDYPGVGGRTLADDGVIASATLSPTPVPEPDTALLLSFGLGGLALLGRERRVRA